MKIRLTVILFFPTFLVWMSPTLEIWQIYLLVGLMGLVAFGAFPQQTAINEKIYDDNEKIVSLHAFKKFKQDEIKNTIDPDSKLETIFESQFVYEADMMAAMLNQHGLQAHVFNRNSASILVHPLGDMKVKVLVSHHQKVQALDLIAKYQSDSFPEDTSIA